MRALKNKRIIPSDEATGQGPPITLRNPAWQRQASAAQSWRVTWMQMYRSSLSEIAAAAAAADDGNDDDDDDDD